MIVTIVLKTGHKTVAGNEQNVTFYSKIPLQRVFSGDMLNSVGGMNIVYSVYDIINSHLENTPYTTELKDCRIIIRVVGSAIIHPYTLSCPDDLKTILDNIDEMSLIVKV